MKSIALALVLVVVLAPHSKAEAPQPADTIFLNGTVHTVNDSAPEAEAIAIKGERILFVGSNDEAKKYAGPATRTIDLAGKTVVPGFTDSHYHIFGVGERLMRLNLEGAMTYQRLLDTIKRQAEELGPSRWITGRGWIETFWKPPVFPTREDLDKVAPDNPVFLIRADGHGAVANSEALKAAGIDAKTRDPFGGEILHDKKTGEPNGMLLDNAMDLVEKKLPPPSPEENEKALLLGATRSVKLGLCEIQNAGSYLPQLDLMQKLYSERKIKLRIYNAVYGPGEAASKVLKDGPILDAYDHHFTTRTIKVIFDGSLGSRSAALLAPYSDADTSGFLTQKESDLRPMFREALRRGIQVETHAIGDRANRTILDLYEEAFKAVPPNGAQSEGTALAGRARADPESVRHSAFRQVGRDRFDAAVACDQRSLFRAAPAREKRLAGAYAWQSLLKSGAIITAGSDAPVEEGNPMIEFYAAVARKSHKRVQRPGLASGAGRLARSRLSRC